MGEHGLSQMGQGCCVNCGFLAIASRYEPEHRWGFSEVSEDRRTKSFGPTAVSIARLQCFRGVADLPKEMEALSDVVPHERHLPVINKYRMCPEWYPWTPGYDPNWHYEELRMLRLEKDRQRFEQDMEQRRREFEQKMENEKRYWDEKTEKSRRKFEIVLFLIVLIFAGLEVTAGVLGLTNESWIIRQLGLD